MALVAAASGDVALVLAAAASGDVALVLVVAVSLLMISAPPESTTAVVDTAASDVVVSIMAVAWIRL